MANAATTHNHIEKKRGNFYYSLIFTILFK